jgi:hypothetical protein
MKLINGTPEDVLTKNLYWFCDHEDENPEEYGKRIYEISMRLGC